MSERSLLRCNGGVGKLEDDVLGEHIVLGRDKNIINVKMCHHFHTSSVMQFGAKNSSQISYLVICLAEVCVVAGNEVLSFFSGLSSKITSLRKWMSFMFENDDSFMAKVSLSRNELIRY